MAYGDLARWMHEDSNRGRIEHVLNEDRPFKMPFDLRKRGPLGIVKNDIHITEKDLSQLYDKKCPNYWSTTKEKIIAMCNNKEKIIELVSNAAKKSELPFAGYNSVIQTLNKLTKEELTEYLECEKVRISQTNKIYFCTRYDQNTTRILIPENKLEACKKTFYSILGGCYK